MQKLYRNFRLIPTYLLFISTFALAAASKLSSPAVPEWFVKQFANTVLNPFPGALSLMFYGLAGLELLVAALFALSVIRQEYRAQRPRPVLDWAFVAAQLSFVALALGQRVSGDFNGAAQLFFYFGVTLIAARFSRVEV